MGGGGGGANSQQAHDVVTMSMRRNDVASTSFRRHVPTRFLINQCQTITFLILKSDIINRKFKNRIERNSFASSFKSKLHLLLFYPSTWYICDFFLFHIEIEGKGGWNIGGGGGGGAKGMLAPPLKLLGGGPPPIFLRLCSSICCSLLRWLSLGNQCNQEHLDTA